MGAITIVGLGPGDAKLLTREAWEVLTQTDEVHVRTARHPTLAGLPDTVRIESFDDLYESHTAPEDVYASIADRVFELAERPQGVVYAVPGNPFVAEATVRQVCERSMEADIETRVVQGLSFVEPVLEVLGVEALPHLALLDAIEIASRFHPSYVPEYPALLAQLYSRSLAADVKLTLMNEYPDEHRVALVHAAGTDAADVEWLPLHAMDRSERISHLTALYVPPRPAKASFTTLQNTVAHLRAPDGCPWDREQSHATLRRNLLEETYEVLAAIDAGDARALAEELGDLLLQIVLQTQIAIDEDEFYMADVVTSIHDKLVRRHPHVFGDLAVDDVDAVIHNWETLKAAERASNDAAAAGGMLSGVPQTLPALAQADAYQARAARVGFDWPDEAGVRAKIDEELGETESAQTEAERHAELGDLLFAVVNWARWRDVEPESALREANARFRRRFEWMETRVASEGRKMSELSLAELEGLWEAAKAASADD